VCIFLKENLPGSRQREKTMFGAGKIGCMRLFPVLIALLVSSLSAEIDAATLGNHEFDYGWEQTEKLIAAAKYLIVSSNIADDQGHLITKKPWVILKVNGLRVGVACGDPAKPSKMRQFARTVSSPSQSGRPPRLVGCRYRRDQHGKVGS
jgi:hypothetical protein